MDLSELPAGRFLRHPWELARSTFFKDQLARAGLLSGARRVLDVGAGDAWFARELARAAPELEVVCWDLGYDQARPEPAERIRYTATRPEGPFDVVLMLDVAEHVADDAAFLADVLELAAGDANVLFSVPAWPALYSRHDEGLRHYRRYTPGEARNLLDSAGLRIQRSGGLFHSLLLPRFLQTIGRERPAPGAWTAESPMVPDDLVWKGSQWSRDAVLGALAVDRGLTNLAANLGLDIPGLSWWALCRK